MVEQQTFSLLSGADQAAHRAAVEAGLASLDAGRGVALAEVRRWMATWFCEGELPPPFPPG